MDRASGSVSRLVIIAAACSCGVGGGVVSVWCAAALLVGVVVVFIDGEFDPGSGRTLAACLTHASRTVNLLRWGISGERVSNT